LIKYFYFLDTLAFKFSLDVDIIIILLENYDNLIYTMIFHSNGDYISISNNFTVYGLKF